MVRRNLLEKAVKLARQFPDIVASYATVGDHNGSTSDYLHTIGFTKSELRKLENADMVVRGYKQYKHGLETRWTFLEEAVKAAEEVLSE